MDTKNTLLALIYQAQSNYDGSLHCLFTLINQAIAKTHVDDINWYIMNDMAESDVLLLIVQNDIDLSINFNDLVLFEAVKYVCSLKSL